MMSTTKLRYSPNRLTYMAAAGSGERRERARLRDGWTGPRSMAAQGRDGNMGKLARTLQSGAPLTTTTTRSAYLVAWRQARTSEGEAGLDGAERVREAAYDNMASQESSAIV